MQISMQISLVNLKIQPGKASGCFVGRIPKPLGNMHCQVLANRGQSWLFMRTLEEAMLAPKITGQAPSLSGSQSVPFGWLLSSV